MLPGCASGRRGDNPALAAQLGGILDDQAAAWNRGDIDAFMTAYWRSPELTFSSAGQTHAGWQATYDRYRARYPTPERMGTLTFDVDAVRPLGRDHALLLGRWRLARAPDPVGGNFTLLWARTADGWRIIHDHTSLRPAAP